MFHQFQGQNPVMHPLFCFQLEWGDHQVSLKAEGTETVHYKQSKKLVIHNKYNVAKHH